MGVLTKRELSVLDVIVLGYTNKKIALTLGIAISTVEYHRANISRKLEAKSLAELISWHNAHFAIGSADLYYDIINRSSDLIWRSTTSGEYTFLSPSLYEVSGFKPEELLNKQFSEWAGLFIAPEYLSWAIDSLSDRASGRLGTDPLKFEVELLRKNGSRYMAEINSGPILSDSGKIIGIQGINRVKE